MRGVGFVRCSAPLTVSASTEQQMLWGLLEEPWTLLSFQALQHDLVDAAVKIESARLLLQRAADASDTAGTAEETLSAMAKLAASAAATGATDTGMRLMAGWGMARDLPMQRFFRDARLYTFAPLTDEMTRNYLGEKLLGLPRPY
jgi:acyl-CoA dehydrogenase